MMLKINFKFFLLFLFLSFLPLKTFAASTPTFDNIVFFGDSLSDDGNLYNVDLGLLPKSPPYFRGRFSNGPVWSERIAARFIDKNITSQNYAIGGEPVNYHDPFDGYLPFDLTDSLDDYYLHNLLTDKSQTLFVFWMGANDYFHKTTEPNKVVTEVVTTIEATIQNLIAHGAKNFLIINLPDIGETPWARTDGSVAMMTAITNLHNAKLQSAVVDLQNKNAGVILHLFDVNALYLDLLKNPASYNEKYKTHITNVTDSCWAGGLTMKQMQQNENSISLDLEKNYKTNLALNYERTVKHPNFQALAHHIASDPDLGSAYAASKSFADGIQPCADPDSYAFWDSVHPTSAVHSILSDVLFATINQYFQG
jgi:phospholipase/lecithinase/hemolysin